MCVFMSMSMSIFILLLSVVILCLCTTRISLCKPFSYLVLVMPGYHVVLAMHELDNGGHNLYESKRPRVYRMWRSDEPLLTFPDLPIGGYQAVSRTWAGSNRQLLARMQSKSTNYTIARVYRNYEGNLDLYIDKGPFRLHYVLTMPQTIPTNVIVYDDAPWPQPVHWYYAVGKVYQGREPNYAVDDSTSDDETLFRRYPCWHL